VGRQLVERLIKMPGYDVTLFNRGKSNADLFKDVKQIHGNRESEDYKLICNENWDCIIDFSGYYPNTFETLLQALKGKVSRYVFISTISVFNLGELSGKAINEGDETLPCSDAQKSSKLPDAYGEKKAEMERILLNQDWLDKIIFRPSFIYGKFDWTERFYYWLYRAKFSDKILMPGGSAGFKLSLTNADDLTEALVQSIEIKNHQTIYNTISQRVSSLREVVSLTANAVNRNPEIIATDKATSKSNEQSDFPLFVPLDFEIDNSRFEKDFPFERADMVKTFLEMLDYKEQQGFPKPPVGYGVEKEQEIINRL